MKKVWIIIICAVLLAACVTLSIIFWDDIMSIFKRDDVGGPTKLTTPTVTLNGRVASWDADPLAEKFEISVNGSLSYMERSVTERVLDAGQSFKVRAIGDNVNYYDSEWSNLVVYNGDSSDTPGTYTVIWRNGDTIIETDYGVAAGTVPEYNGQTPTKAPDLHCTYVFIGWSPEVTAVNDNVIYNAVFKTVLNTYTVTWMSGNRILEVDDSVEYGSMPVYDGTEPSKNADTQYVYIFTGWSPELSEVTGNITYTAQFTTAPNSYTIVWKNGDTVLEVDEKVEYGTIPTYDGATPVKPDLVQYTYEFIGWDPQISEATKSVTYYAQYIQSVRRYNVTFYADDGITVLDTASVEYGANAEYIKSTPVKNDSEMYSYSFEKWVTQPGGYVEDDLTRIISDRNVYASYKRSARLYTVNVVASNSTYGTVSLGVIEGVPYGTYILANGNTVTVNGQSVSASPTAESAEYRYDFTGWSSDIAVYSDTVIVANFTRTVNTYTVTWKNGDTTLEVDEGVMYGEIPEYNGALPVKSAGAYLFSGWNTPVSAVVGNVVYEAQFVSADNRYTVTFYSENGEVILGVAVVQAGADAVYPNATPEKPSTANESYTFDKWVDAKGGSTEAVLKGINANKSVYAKFKAEDRLYTVTFIDWNGEVISTDAVKLGASANAPADPYRSGYRFDKWSTAINNITSDTEVYATYVRTYTVRFVDYDGSVLSISVVNKGESVTAPTTPTRKNYTFVGWSTSTDNVLSDITARAEYRRHYYVTFVDWDGTVISSSIVEPGEDAVAPQIPVHEGYAFVSWSGSYKNVNGDITVSATYKINTYTVTFTDPDGTVISKLDDVPYGSVVSAPATVNTYFDWRSTKCYEFTGWRNWDPSQPIYGDITVVAEYSKQIEGPIIAIETKSLENGKNQVKISVYLCGDVDEIYGINLKIKYSEALTLSDKSISVSEKLSGYEAQLDTAKCTYDFSWANGQSIDVGDRIKLFELTFTVDSYTAAGEYLIELMPGTYIISQDLSKQIPLAVIGKVTIEE